MPPFDPENPDEDGVLEPDELDITDYDESHQLDENRFLITTDNEASPLADTDTTASQPTDTENETNRIILSGEIMNQPVSTKVEADNMVELFSQLLTWYANKVGDPQLTTEETLEILLNESNLNSNTQ